MQNIIKLTDISNFENLMSSREIAELCEKRHKHVIRDICKMLDNLGINLTGPNLGSLNFKEQTEKLCSYNYDYLIY